MGVGIAHLGTNHRFYCSRADVKSLGVYERNNMAQDIT